MTILRDLLHWESLSALHNNVLVVALMLLYFKVSLETIAARVRGEHETKPCIFLLLSTSVLFWPLFDDTDGWSWRLNTLLPAAMMARFVTKGLTKTPDDAEVQALSRSSSPSELLWGPVQLTAVLIYLGLYCFQTQEAGIIAAALGVGDGLAAPLIGTQFGRHVYQMPLASPKTMEGSVVGVFLGTVSASYLYLYGMGLPLLPLRMVLTYGAIAAVVEGTAPGNLDNLAIPVVLHFSMDVVQEWLPA
jgi:dolichol kinase